MIDFTRYVVKKIHSHSLTQKEQIVLHYCLCGYSEQSISSLIEISVKTVKTYVQKLFKKFNVHTKLQLFHIFFPVEEDIDYLDTYPKQDKRKDYR